MQDHPDNDATLDRYLHNEMDAQERKQFEEQLAADTTLTEDLELHRDTIAGIGLDGSQALKKRLQAVEAELASPAPAVVATKQTSRRFLTTWVAVAASLLTVLMLGYLFFIPPSASPQELYVAYHEPFPNLINPAQRSVEVVEETVLEQAVRAYDAQQYDQALALFAQSDALNTPGYTFYYAASYLESDQPERAIPLFERMIKEETSLFYEPSQWYLALAYLKVNQPEAARPYLQSLAEQEGDYTEKAASLLDELE
ncbi:MAG: tetratricopeptide repeat protein [Tunicatimonas sp.]